MCLPRKHELHRTFRVIDHGRYLLDVGQNQIGALVGGKAARETNGERVGTEGAFQLLQHGQRFVAARSLFDGAAAHKLDHSRLQIEVRLPEFAVVNVVNAFPDLGLAAAQLPSRAQMAIVEAKHLRGQPSGDMNAVGDVSDGHRVFQFAREKSSPHGAGNFAVQRGNGVGVPRQLQAEHGHAETFVAVGMFASQRHETFLGKTERLAQRSEVLFDQIGIETIVAGGHWSVGGEDHFAGNPRHRLVEADAFLFHPLANRFEDGKSAVPFVEVKNSRRDAERFQSAQAAHAEQQFLMHAHPAVAPIQPRCHLAVFRGIALHVGVEQKHITSAHFHAPYFCIDRTMPGIDLHHNRSAVLPDRRFHRQLVEVGFEVLFMLPAVAIQALAEISLAVKQAHADQWDAQIGSTLDVIARQNAKSTGIDRKRFVHAKFSGKVRHRTGPQHTGVACAPGALRILVLAQAAIGVVDPAVQDEFGGARLEFGERIFVQQRDRAVIELTPSQGVNIAEQAARIVIPAPPQIAGQRPQPLLSRRDETVERARFAHDVRYPVRRLGEQTNLILREDSRLQGLHHQNALQHAAIDERNSQERVVIVLASLAEVLEARMILDLFHGHRADLFSDQAGQAFTHCHAKFADAFPAQPDGRGQHQIGAVRFQQVGGANIDAKPPGNQRDHVHQGLGGLARLRRQVRDFVPRQHEAGLERAGGVLLILN